MSKNQYYTIEDKLKKQQEGENIARERESEYTKIILSDEKETLHNIIIIKPRRERENIENMVSQHRRSRFYLHEI